MLSGRSSKICFKGGSAEVCMLEQSVSVKPKEEKIRFGAVPSLLCFVVEFYAL